VVFLAEVIQQNPFQKMKQFLSNNWWYFVGTLAGAVAGYFYWQQIGCVNGTCMITSKPLNSVVYFAVLGALIVGMFTRKRKEQH
jgi:FtsH-binding integral membrane protein